MERGYRPLKYLHAGRPASSGGQLLAVERGNQPTFLNLEDTGFRSPSRYVRMIDRR